MSPANLQVDRVSVPSHIAVEISDGTPRHYVPSLYQ